MHFLTTSVPIFLAIAYTASSLSVLCSNNLRAGPREVYTKRLKIQSTDCYIERQGPRTSNFLGYCEQSGGWSARSLADSPYGTVCDRAEYWWENGQMHLWVSYGGRTPAWRQWCPPDQGGCTAPGTSCACSAGGSDCGKGDGRRCGYWTSTSKRSVSHAEIESIAIAFNHTGLLSEIEDTHE